MRTRALVLLLFVLFFVAAPANAKFTVATTADPAPIKPGVEARITNATFTVDCADVRLATIVEGRITVAVQWTAPTGVLVSGPGNTVMPLEACKTNPNGQITSTTTYSLSASRNVAGEVPLQATMQAIYAGTQTEAGQKAETPLSFTVAAYLLVSLATESKTLDLAPGNSGTIIVMLTNYGNVATDVAIEASTNATTFDTHFPSSVRVERNGTVAVDLNITARDAVGFVKHEELLIVNFQPSSAILHAKTQGGGVLTMTNLVGIRSAGGGTSSPRTAASPSAFIAALLSVLGAAVVVSRRRA